MNQAQFNQGMLEFIQNSPDPFHAVASMSALLRVAGFIELEEKSAWQLQAGARYFTTRNGSALVAFTVGNSDPVECGMRMTGAHTDSPCLKVKPQPELARDGYWQLGVEVYGGALYAPWFDRDLSLAGRVDFLDEKGELDFCLINLRKPVAVIPSLAIHLNRDVNQNRAINAQLELPPLLLSLPKGKKFSFDAFLLETVREQHANARKVLSHEICLYDTQPPALVGLHEQFIASARLDNLLSCYVCLQALLGAQAGGFNVLVCNDHEEVGSVSSTGADGTFMRSVLERILAQSGTAVASAENFERMIRQSHFLSVDNAHGIHPNYSDKHDVNHGPLLNHGPVLKINNNQRYASNSHSQAMFKTYCEKEGVSVQSFVVRSDMACGSTIGPVTAASLGVQTVDIGVPTFAMHSIRELAGAEDGFNLSRVITRYFSEQVSEPA